MPVNFNLKVVPEFSYYKSIGSTETITPYSIPQYSTMGFGGWSCGEWQQWHQQLKTIYPLVEANDRFLAYWADSGVYGSYCELNNTFVEYFRQQGINLNTLLNTAGQVAENLGSGVNSATQGVKMTGQVIKYGLVALTIYWGYKTFIAPKKDSQ